MKYISTRGNSPALNFEQVLLAGLAPDGGLYVPEVYPSFTKEEISNMANLNYAELAAKIMSKFTQGCLDENELLEITTKVYKNFAHKAVAPLKQLDSNLWVMQLFQGPTLAFKDYALQVVGQLFDTVLKKTNKHITIVGATSGDTGSAAIHGCKGCKNLDIFILHPHNRVSDVQRHQMTTVLDKNVHNIALEGTFDDCQSLVKDLFNNKNFREKHSLSAINSINWARIMAQVVYYFYAALNLGAPHKKVSFAVPTGNFGNVFAGFVAKKMGLPIDQLVIGSNSNDILPRFLNSGIMEQKKVVPSISPSMDIQISSNFERFLFETLDRDSNKINELMKTFKAECKFQVSKEEISKISYEIKGLALNDSETKQTISEIYKNTSEIFDPHSAIGFKAGQHYAKKDIPMIILATAHPSKFPIPVKEATGVYPELPNYLSDLLSKKEEFTVLENNISKVIDFIETEQSK
ncbi:MAG: threonine synthase [Alphaproteobacteria bacterium]|nr:threonine synthase [Alphaproteobacteria bacterium]